MSETQQSVPEHPRVLLFDIDATLLRTGHAGTRALNRIFEQMYGISGAMDGIRPGGKTDPMILREILESKLGHLSADEEIPKIAPAYLECLEHEVDQSVGFRLMQGVKELLEALSRTDGILLGLATGNFETAAWMKLRRAGLDSYFGFGGFGSDAEDRTEVIRTAIRRAEDRLGHAVRLDLVYVIGDTHRDILHGKEAGARVVAVATGGTSLSEMASYGPDFLLADLADTEQVLRILLGEESCQSED